MGAAVKKRHARDFLRDPPFILFALVFQEEQGPSDRMRHIGCSHIRDMFSVSYPKQ